MHEYYSYDELLLYAFLQLFLLYILVTAILQYEYFIVLACNCLKAIQLVSQFCMYGRQTYSNPACQHSTMPTAM